MATSLLTPKEVERRTGEKRSTRFNKIRAGLHPKPIYTGPKSPRFIESEIDAYVEGLIRQARAKPVKPNKPGRPRGDDRPSAK